MIQDYYYKIKNQKIINETIDGETIIINFENGNYYRLDEIGSDIWAFFQKGSYFSQIISHVAVNYDQNGHSAEEHIGQFISRLEAENLIIRQNGTDRKLDDSTLNQSAATKKLIFKIPNIEKYEDMQAFLLADPIHEVEDSGWPDIKK